MYIEYSVYTYLVHPHVRESVSGAPYAPSPHSRIRRWSDDEIARIRAVLRKLTSLRIRNDDDAEDLVQETLLTMTRKCPEEELQKGLLVWSMGILRKKVGNYYRKSQRFTNVNSEEMLAQKGGECASLAAVQESHIHHHELLAIIDVLLDRFPTRQRQAMELLLLGLRTHEIAEELSTERYQNIANRLYRGRKKLARELARFGYRPTFVRARSKKSRKTKLP